MSVRKIDPSHNEKKHELPDTATDLVVEYTPETESTLGSWDPTTLKSNKTVTMDKSVKEAPGIKDLPGEKSKTRLDDTETRVTAKS